MQPVDQPATAPHSARRQRRFAYLLWGSVLLANACLVAVVAIVVLQNRQRANETAELLVTNYARILEESVAGLIGKVDVTLQSAVDEIGPRDGGDFARPPDIRGILVRQSLRIPETFGLRLVDARGDIRFIAGELAAAPYGNVAKRAWFARMKADPQAGLIISKPVLGGVVKQPIITLARRLQGKGDAFTGNVQAALAIGTFIDIFARLDLGANGNVGLWDKDALYARYSRDDAKGKSAGATTPSRQLAELLRSDQREAIYLAVSGVDGIKRIYAYRKLGATPFHLVVGLAEEDYLAAWRADSIRVAMLGGLFVFVTLALAWLIQSAWRKKEAAINSLREQTRKAEAATRQVELLLSSVGEGVCGVDTDGRIIFANPAARRMLGWNADEGIGENLHALTHHHYPDGTPYPGEACAITETLEDGQRRNVVDDCYWRKDGSPFPVEFTVSPILKGGKLAGAVNVFQDITERKKANAELLAAKLAAEAANTAKGDFLANMSHEIRTPLNGVLGLAQIGYRDNAGSSKAQQAFGRILDSGKLLLTIINDILDFSKIEAGKLDIEDIPFSPARLVDETLQGVFILAAAKSISLGSEKSGLPAAALGDPLRIAQILYNLLSNAVKFTEQGKVTLSARQEDHDLVFAVIDTGVGISQEALDRLFQPFEQADSSTTRRFGGTGLGLAISRRLANLMGGRLEVASVLGQGSTFTLRIPFRTTDQPVPADKPQATPGNHRLRGLRLLVAEDNTVNQLVLDDLLRGEGAEVTLAGNGAEAIERVASAGRAFDAVLMDVQMPVMDGLEATRRLKQTQPGLPVIGQTAHALKEEIDKCHAAGMLATVNKPIDLEILVSTLLECLPAAHRPGPVAVATEYEAAPSPIQVVDWAAFNKRYANRGNLIDRLVPLFLKGHAEHGARLRAQVAADDIVGIERLAHELKGTAGNLCATEVQHQAVLAMEAAREGRPEARDLALALAGALDRLILALRNGRPDST